MRNYLKNRDNDEDIQGIDESDRGRRPKLIDPRIAAITNGHKKNRRGRISERIKPLFKTKTAKETPSSQPTKYDIFEFLFF